jgi:hypothetical protein
MSLHLYCSALILFFNVKVKLKTFVKYLVTKTGLRLKSCQTNESLKEKRFQLKIHFDNRPLLFERRANDLMKISTVIFNYSIKTRFQKYWIQFRIKLFWNYSPDYNIREHLLQDVTHQLTLRAFFNKIWCP